MKKYIGIMAAMKAEFEPIKQRLDNIETEEIYNLIFYKGNIVNKDYILVQCRYWEGKCSKNSSSSN